MGEEGRGFSRRHILEISVGVCGFALSGTTALVAGRQGSKAEPLNIARIRRLYEALAKRDVEFLNTFLSPAVVFHIPGTGLVAGEHRGKEAIMRLFRAVNEQTRGSFKTDLLEVVANEQYAVTKHRWTAERNSKRIEMDNINVFRFDKEGKLIERWEFIENQQAHDEFWS